VLLLNCVLSKTLPVLSKNKLPPLSPIIILLELIDRILGYGLSYHDFLQLQSRL
jgi:hypothetical protein